uniref:Uncharacterized protein n=1 Tax=Leviviridae sp. TaxID=2027243 RepID=A0A514CZR5_9VIRU|nr:MAG: hypothetical protein H2Rhizo32860_000003 [Leviviridae sp.]
MRSSPKFLAANRSERADSDDSILPDVQKSGSHRRPHRDDVEFNELNIQLRISYKTLVLVFVLFDVFHKGINVLIDTDFVQNIFN